MTHTQLLSDQTHYFICHKFVTNIDLNDIPINVHISFLSFCVSLKWEYTFYRFRSVFTLEIATHNE